MKLPFYLFLFAIALLQLLLGVPAAQAANSVAAEETLDSVTLQLKWKHQFQFAGYYAAVEKGFYRDHGLNVIIKEAGDGENPANLVLQGKAEFGIASSDLVLLRSQGKPVVVLAPIFQHSPLILLVLAASGIDNVHELKGRDVMVEEHAEELLAYLQNEGLPSSEIKILPHSFDPESLIQGKVAAMSAYSTDEPFLLKKLGMPYLTFTPRSGGIDFYGDTLFTTEDQIKKHPKKVQQFLNASLLGWNYALSHPDEIIKLILTKYSTRHSREHLEFEAAMTQKLILPNIVEIGYTNPGRWDHIRKVYSRLGLLPEGVELDGFLYERNPQPDILQQFWPI